MQRDFDFSTLSAQRNTIRELLETFRVSLCHRIDGHDTRVVEMMKYVHLHLFRKSLTVEEIKEACRCKNNNIVTFFKQVLETDIRRYIASRRLDAAEYVMRRKKVTISLLASCVGYTEELFWRDFKAKYGCTPLEFMKVNCEELRSAQTVEMPDQDARSR